MRRVRRKTFFNRDALAVARDLLGDSLCRRGPDGTITRLSINEVEAYLGPEDRACHAHIGRTRRTEVMFRPAGIWYIYLCYGIHWLANVVTGPENFPAAVLLRGAGEFDGPGKLTKGLGVTGEYNDRRATRASGFWIEAGPDVPENEVTRTPRIGIDYAGPDWSQRPLRLVCR